MSEQQPVQEGESAPENNLNHSSGKKGVFEPTDHITIDIDDETPAAAADVYKRRRKLVKQLLDLYYRNGRGFGVMNRRREINRVARGYKINPYSLDTFRGHGSGICPKQLKSLPREGPIQFLYEHAPGERLYEQAREIARKQRTKGRPDNHNRKPSNPNSPSDHDYWCARDPRGQGVWFFLSIKGHIRISKKPLAWSPGLSNEDFRNVLQKEYRRIYSRLSSWSSWSSWFGHWFKEIGFVYFDLWESYEDDFWVLQDKDYPLEVNNGRAEKSVMDHFRYLLRHPPNYGRLWSQSVDNMVSLNTNVPATICPACGQRRLDHVIMIEIVENISTSAIIVMTVLLIFASLIIGIVYAAVKDEAGDAFAIASYAITAFAFFVAIYAAGQWLGMESPESFIDHVSADYAWLEGAVFRT